MKGILKVFAKDLREFFKGIRWVVFLLVVPVSIMIIVGQLRVQVPSLVILLNADMPEGVEDIILSGSKLSNADIVVIKEDIHDPLRIIREKNIDLLIQYDDEEEKWFFFTAETSTVRLETITHVVSSLERIFFLLDNPYAYEEETLIPIIQNEIVNIGGMNTTNLTCYYPEALNYSLNLLPMAIALISCFMPFVISSTSLIREKESNTLGLLLIAPGITPDRLFAGKCILPVVTGLFNFLSMLLVAEFLYHLHIKTGFFPIISVTLLVLLSSALLGLIVSAVGKSQLQAVIFSSVYFLFSILLGGFFFPLNESTALVQWLSKTIPLTFYFPVIEGWIYGGFFVPTMEISVKMLAFQCILYAIIALFVFRISLRRT